MLQYRVTLHREEEGQFWLEIPDFPGFTAYGDAALDDAASLAADSLATAVELRLHHREPLPEPSAAQPGDLLIAPMHHPQPSVATE